MTNIKETGTLLEEARKAKEKYNKIFDALVKTVIGVLILLIGFITIGIWFAGNEMAPSEIYKVIAVDIILVWIGILFRYFAWAIYFYNVNLGLTDEDWAEIQDKKDKGEEVDLSDIENPHVNNTLGLPDGTIRGTLALSLAVGALALLIASLGMDTTLPANALFIDTFDFFKTAFLMMVAFYFGNKSLQYLNLSGTPIKQGSGQGVSTTMPVSEESTVTLPAVTSVSPNLKQVANQSQAAEGADISSEADASQSIEGSPNAKG